MKSKIAAMKPRTALAMLLPCLAALLSEAAKPDTRACYQEARIKDNRYNEYYLTFSNF